MADSRATLQAARQAEFSRTALLSLLRGRRFLDSLPRACRFELREGSLVVPPHVGWLEAPELPGFDDLDVLVQDKLDQVERAGKDEARVLLLNLLQGETQPRAHRDWLRARAAWHAHRAGRAAWRDVLLRELDSVDGGAAVASTLLLHAELGGRLPDWATNRVASLPEDLALPLLSRLAEKGSRTEELNTRLADALAERRTLRSVQSHLTVLEEQPSPIVRPVEDRLLLFQGDPATEGAGALLSYPGLLESLAALDGEPWTGLPPRLHEDLGQVEDGSTESVVPGFLAHRPRPSPSGGLGGPLGLGILIAALALFSGAGLWQLQRSLRKEAEAARVRSEFLTMVTHELKTPLAGIRLLAEMLEDGHLEPGQLAGYHTRLSSESRRLGMLIENVLDLGRMERGERGFDFRPLELDGLLREARGLYGPIAERSRLEMSVSQGAARVIQGDRDALLQSLLNVMDNARKYAACGGRLDLRSAANGERCRILVRDYGPGIRAEERSAVFERFRRGSRHQDGSIPGVGLGLHLARSILRSHGGDLVAQSPADGGPGACFCFTLPAAPPVQPDETVEEL